MRTKIEAASPIHILLRMMLHIVVAVLFFALTFAIEVRFETRIASVTGFATLITLVFAGIGFCFDRVVDRLLFGPQVTGKLPLWIKISLGIGLSLGLAIAIWDGIEARQSDNSIPTYKEPLQFQMMRQLNITSQDLERVRQFNAQHSPTSQQ
jgi:hypothetical protein